jgi:GNAT superfamily N-acetyltransferase
VTPKAIGAVLGLDAGYLSRIVGRFEREELVVRARSDADGRSVRLRLTPGGREVFEALQARTVAHVEDLVAGLSPAERGKLARALGEVERLLGAGPAPVVLRAHAPGDLGWITERHATLYHREYGWTGMEALVARICADFLDRDDPRRERCWIADGGGERLGSVMVVDDGEGVARLRLLLLEPAARGLGVGRRLVETAVGFARDAGYRDMVLWTQGVLTAARAIYAAVGFELVETRPVENFGAHTHSETWRMSL